MERCSNVACLFVSETLRIQKDIAVKVGKALAVEEVCVFTTTDKFKNKTSSIVDGFRYVRADDGSAGVLSQAAQEVFTNPKDYEEFIKYDKSTVVASDGDVYVKVSA